MEELAASGGRNRQTGTASIPRLSRYGTAEHQAKELNAPGRFIKDREPCVRSSCERPDDLSIPGGFLASGLQFLTNLNLRSGGQSS